VVEQHRSEIGVISESGKCTLPIIPSMLTITVGDWLLVDSNAQYVRVLERNSGFIRKAAGSKLAANVDASFIVCSVKADFNLNRIE
jgi:ribosome biogenesis GTPase